MSFHFCSHAWEVRDLTDGTQVTISNRDLDEETIPILVDDLHQLVLESGQPNLYLDLERIGLVAGLVLGKLADLDARLRTHGGRLILVNVRPATLQQFQDARLTETLDVRGTA